MRKGLSVTTIIPAYRAAGTIARALDSLLAQTRPPDEILVVDDGSPDDLAAAAFPYGDRVVLLRKPNGGAASARNYGIERAGGDFVAFLDADDYWEPHKLERQLDVFRRHPQVGLVCSRYFTEEPGRPRTAPARAGGAALDRVVHPRGRDAFALATQMWTTTVLVRRTVLGEIRFTPGLEPAEDRDVWVRLIDAVPVVILAEPLATCVLTPGSLSRSNLDIDCGNMLRVVHRHGGLLGRRGVREWEAKTYGKWAAGHLGNGRPRQAIGPAWNRLRRQPCSAEAWWVLAKSCLLTCKH